MKEIKLPKTITEQKEYFKTLTTNKAITEAFDISIGNEQND